VSGGERKRVSIAEACLSGCTLQCWDNSTRGLDSATALEFVKTLRVQSNATGASAVVAIYQASQSAYDVGTLSDTSLSVCLMMWFAGLRQSHPAL
jgi:ABC-type multidrug transport system ATPase subunit